MITEIDQSQLTDAMFLGENIVAKWFPEIDRRRLEAATVSGALTCVPRGAPNPRWTSEATCLSNLYRVNELRSWIKRGQPEALPGKLYVWSGQVEILLAGSICRDDQVAHEFYRRAWMRGDADLLGVHVCAAETGFQDYERLFTLWFTDEIRQQCGL